MKNYTITTNAEYNSKEITFTEKPSEAIRNALKNMKFRWNSFKKVWYGFAIEEEIIKAIESAKNDCKPVEIAPAPKPVSVTEEGNIYGVKVGDIFSSTWGYEQTNVDFFQVVALVGKASVRVREVYLPMIEDSAVSPMSADRTYKITSDILPAKNHSCFISDQENGDLKRLKPGFERDPEIAKNHCFFSLTNYAHATKCNGETVKTYESWYA